MRVPPAGAHQDLLRYGIREIVDVVQRLQALDPRLETSGENIGDPVAKGWTAPDFIREILTGLVRSADPQVMGYTHSRGRVATRRWVTDYARRFSPASRLEAEQVLFVNGLGAGISAIYRMLAPAARVLQPQPAYPTHASLESFHAGAESLGYRLDHARGWQPDLDHLAYQVERHPEVAGILVISPNNPTGAVYPAETLERIVQLAQRHRLMLIADEVYFRLVFEGACAPQLTEAAQGRVPLLVLRGVSKDVPWPGGRCGWLEFHNTELDPDFRDYCEGIKKAVLLEVCATSLPQAALPLIYDHPAYEPWRMRYCLELAANSRAIGEILGAVPGLRVNPIAGAFYMTILFDHGVLRGRQTLPIRNRRCAEYIQALAEAPDLPSDKRFAYYLLAATGICVVPASDFQCAEPGFRITTLERDPQRRDRIYRRLADAVTAYQNS